MMKRQLRIRGAWLLLLVASATLTTTSIAVAQEDSCECGDYIEVIVDPDAEAAVTICCTVVDDNILCSAIPPGVRELFRCFRKPRIYVIDKNGTPIPLQPGDTKDIEVAPGVQLRFKFTWPFGGKPKVESIPIP